MSWWRRCEYCGAGGGVRDDFTGLEGEDVCEECAADLQDEMRSEFDIDELIEMGLVDEDDLDYDEEWEDD